jgi:hypothetical protein
MGFTEALDELQERANAVAGMEPSEEEHISVVVGQPSDLIRKMMLGYFPPEDTEMVLAFLDDASLNIQRLIAAAGTSSAARDAGLRFTVIQFLIVGVALGRQG